MSIKTGVRNVCCWLAVKTGILSEFFLLLIGQILLSLLAGTIRPAKRLQWVGELVSNILSLANYLVIIFGLQTEEWCHLSVVTYRSVWRGNVGAHVRTGWNAPKQARGGTQSKSTAKPLIAKARQKQPVLSSCLWCKSPQVIRMRSFTWSSQ